MDSKRSARLKSKKQSAQYVKNAEKLADTVAILKQSAKNLKAEIKDTEDDIHRTSDSYKQLVENQRKQNPTRTADSD